MKKQLYFLALVVLSITSAGTWPLITEVEVAGVARSSAGSHVERAAGDIGGARHLVVEPAGSGSIRVDLNQVDHAAAHGYDRASRGEAK